MKSYLTCGMGFCFSNRSFKFSRDDAIIFCDRNDPKVTYSGSK